MYSPRKLFFPNSLFTLKLLAHTTHASTLLIRSSSSSFFFFKFQALMASSSETNVIDTKVPNVAFPSEGSEKPKIEPVKLPTPEDIVGQDIWNNCAIRSVFSGVMGGGLGLFMGLLIGALDSPAETMTGRQQLVYAAKNMGSRSLSSAKTFAIMGLVFSAAECVVEKARARHDTTNTAVAGCVTGGALSARGGPQAACMGCAGFATFSVLIEKFLDRHD